MIQGPQAAELPSSLPSLPAHRTGPAADRAHAAAIRALIKSPRLAIRKLAVKKERTSLKAGALHEFFCISG